MMRMCRLLLRRVDNENIALALTGVIKEILFPSGDHLGDGLRPRDWVHCLTPVPSAFIT